MSNEEGLSRISVDSDCQILEPVIPLIEINSDGDNENANNKNNPETKPNVAELSRSFSNYKSTSLNILNQETCPEPPTLQENIINNEERLSRISVDSDCQILEPDIPLIEINSDGDNENADNKNNPETKPNVAELSRSFSNYKNTSLNILNQETCPEPPTLQENIINNERRLSRISVDSDCQILEPEIVLIEINDIDNNIDPPRSTKSINELSQSCSDNESTNTNEYRRSIDDEKNSLDSNIFRISFNSKEKYIKLKDTIISSLKLSFKEKKLNVEFSEDSSFWEIYATDDGCVKATENTSLLENSLTLSNKISSEMHCNLGSENNLENNNKIVIDSSEKRICFNCNQEHDYKNCTLPKNPTKINKNRRKYYLKSGKYQNTMEERFGCLRPGKLSNGLRSALGLANGKLPSFFYRMRTLGYPPGWLENAKEKYSDDALASIYGDAELDSTDKERNLSTNQFYYNVQKVISFPGFNVHPAGRYFDEYQTHGVPPIDSMQSKRFLMYKLGEMNAQEIYNRLDNRTKKLENSSASETVERSN